MVKTESIRTKVKEQLIATVDALPFEKIQELLDFATFLEQRSNPFSEPVISNVEKSHDEWEESLRKAETYWFSLPETVRFTYNGKVVALLQDRIVDSDTQLRTLKARVRKQFSTAPILYLDADAPQLPPLVLRSPKLR